MGTACAGLRMGQQLLSSCQQLCFGSRVSDMPSRGNERASTRMEARELCDGRWFMMPGCQCDSLSKPLGVGQRARKAGQRRRECLPRSGGTALPAQVPIRRLKVGVCSELGISASSSVNVERLREVSKVGGVTLPLESPVFPVSSDFRPSTLTRCPTFRWLELHNRNLSLGHRN